jgi:hypothetical protein
MILILILFSLKSLLSWHYGRPVILRRAQNICKRLRKAPKFAGLPLATTVKSQTNTTKSAQTTSSIDKPQTHKSTHQHTNKSIDNPLTHGNPVPPTTTNQQN